MATLTRVDRWLAVVLVIVGAAGVWWLWDAASDGSGRAESVAADPSMPRLGNQWVAQTPHYAITTSATMAETQQVGGAVESLYQAYVTFFAIDPGANPGAPLQLTLYKNRAQFKSHNRSRPWAEAYYRAPVSYAYYGGDDKNPTHWMLHEATHQLNTEVAHLKPAKWIDEGLASYFGSSRLEGSVLTPGTVDPDTYPIWWLRSLELSGNPKGDFARGAIVPLRALVTGKGGPDINRNVNAWYIGYWSLTHFLLHYENGRYAPAFRELIAEGGSLQDFERVIGPVDAIQAQWYAYLQQGTKNASETPVLYVIDADAKSSPR